MGDLKIIVDQRERNRELIDALKASGFSITMRTIPSGDYIISERVAIERKTVSDFESSILNGRLFEQARSLKENYALPIIILEGGDADFRLNRNVITGTMVTLYVDYGIEMILSRDVEDTARMLKVIAKHEQTGRIRGEPTAKGSARAYTIHDYQKFVIGNLPGIGPKLADSLLHHFGSIKKIANASIDELMEAEKIGEKKAAMIHATLNEEYRKSGGLYLKS